MRMRRFLLASATVLSILGLSACNTTNGLFPNVPQASESVLDEKALYVAEAAYEGFGNLVIQATQANLLNDEQKQRLRVINQQAYQSLVLARAAQKAADSRSYIEQTTRTLDLIAQAQSIMRSRN